MGNSIECVALIPARSGSKRLSGKNVKELRGHPLLAYTIAAAVESQVFKRVIVSTDCREIAGIARRYGAETPWLRPSEYAVDTSPDIEWLQDALEKLEAAGELTACFSLLRPTSPFRSAETIRRAWKAFLEDGEADSLRAIEKCGEHPAKMWKLTQNDSGKPRMRPVMENPNAGEIPWHSRPYQDLPPVYVQNASLEIAWTDIPLKRNSIAGTRILPFITEGYEGHDINSLEDWIVAEYLIDNGLATLPGLGVTV